MRDREFVGGEAAYLYNSHEPGLDWYELKEFERTCVLRGLAIGHRLGWDAAASAGLESGVAIGVAMGRSAAAVKQEAIWARDHYEAGRQAERAAVVRLLRERRCYTAAGLIESGSHLTPPDPTREQAEERVLDRMARAAWSSAHPDSTTPWHEARAFGWLEGARASWEIFPKPAQDAAIDAMLAEMRKERP
jgi:hypothetical protein